MNVQLTIFNITNLLHGFGAPFQKINEFLKKTFPTPSAFENVRSPDGLCFYYAIAQYFCGASDRRKRRLRQRSRMNPLTDFIRQSKMKKSIGEPASGYNIGK